MPVGFVVSMVAGLGRFAGRGGAYHNYGLRCIANEVLLIVGSKVKGLDLECLAKIME